MSTHDKGSRLVARMELAMATDALEVASIARGHAEKEFVRATQRYRTAADAVAAEIKAVDGE